MTISNTTGWLWGIGILVTLCGALILKRQLDENRLIREVSVQYLVEAFETRNHCGSRDWHSNTRVSSNAYTSMMCNGHLVIVNSSGKLFIYEYGKLTPITINEVLE